MSLQPVTTVSGTAVLAGKHFYDARFDTNRRPTAHPLDDPRFAGASIMITGANFGCGSSREHAPQAIHRSGFRALIGESFAEIFFGNAITLGMPCVTAARTDLETLAAFVSQNPGAEVRIDLQDMTATCAEIPVPIAMPDSARHALLSGRWDPIRELLENETAAARVAASLPYL